MRRLSTSASGPGGGLRDSVADIAGASSILGAINLSPPSSTCARRGMTCTRCRCSPGRLVTVFLLLLALPVLRRAHHALTTALRTSFFAPPAR